MQSNKINLLFAIHCHQPVGNFDSVFEEAYDKAYLPFIKVLQRHPKIKVGLHYSGCLLDWFGEKKPEFLGMLKKLVKGGQTEMIGGGYYEPILPLIPDRDKFGQLKRHLDFIKQNTGCVAEGVWLTERVWEQYLAKIFSQAGLKYTIVDDSHFELAGKKVEDILGYYLTEEEGFPLAVFPSSKKLRYSLPFKLPQETINYLRSVATPDGTRAVTFGDDGEKFGLWPQTYKWVYEEGWLENFFKSVEDNSDWINVITPGEYLKKHEPLGRLYIPCASYPEMLEWSGGYFRNFLVKYPEGNWMHKRMLYTSGKIADAGAKSKNALLALYKAQCNCAYWHGVFGGLYLHHLRNAVYSNLIGAQNILELPKNAKGLLESEVLDIDKDGFDEIVAENGQLRVFVSPKEGGSIIELDYKPKALNITNTLTRRPEAYHKKIKDQAVTEQPTECKNGIASIHESNGAKAKNLSEFLNYDGYRKSFLVDHFLQEGADFTGFSKGAIAEAGDFASGAYKYDLKKAKDGIAVSLEREGRVRTAGNGGACVKLEKVLSIAPGKSILTISYKVKNLSGSDAVFWFGSEFNLSLKAEKFCSAGELLNINKLEINDEWFNVNLKYSLSKAANVWFCPIETISDSETGLEKTYQQFCLMFNWPTIALSPKQAWSVDIIFEIK